MGIDSYVLDMSFIVSLFYFMYIDLFYFLLSNFCGFFLILIKIDY